MENRNILCYAPKVCYFSSCELNYLRQTHVLVKNDLNKLTTMEDLLHLEKTCFDCSKKFYTSVRNE